VRGAFLILLGFGVGLFAGLAWRDEPGPTRRPVRTTTTELPPVERRSEPESVGEAAAERSAPEPIGIERTGVGTLEFDGGVDGDLREGWIAFRHIDGEEDGLEAESLEDGLQRWRLRAGTYRLCWLHGPRDDLRAVEVRIEPGETTRVSAATPAAPDQFPIKPGLGRIEVTVFDLENRRAPQATVEFEYVDVRGEIATCDENAASDGSLRLEILPGDYVVRVGCQEQRVRLRAGETQPLTFRSRSEGEVRFVGGKRCHLVPVVESKTRTHSFARLVDDTGHRYIYMRPGLYLAKLAFPGDVKSRVLGRVDVRPGVITEFTTDPLPTAHLKIAVRRVPDAHTAWVELKPVEPGGQPAHWKLKHRFDGDWVHLTARHLTPGLWRLRVWAAGCDEITRTIEMGVETVSVGVELQRSTIR
jgi:hypothetical protein